MGCFEHIQIRYSDGYTASARLWQPVSPRGALLYLHGIQSHGLWFEASAQRLAEAGVMVLLPDRRGSGRNAVDRGHTPSSTRLIRDVAECLDELHVRSGRDRFHVLGVSWGGKLALAAYPHMRQRVASLTLVAPGLFPKVDIPLAEKIRVGWSALASAEARFDIPLQQVDLFTENPSRQTFIRDDELVLRQATAKFLIASRKLDRQALAVAGEPEGPPIALFLAGQDRIIDNDRTRAFVRGLPWSCREIFEYEHAHHTLDFEADPQRFFDDLTSWVKRCVAET